MGGPHLTGRTLLAVFAHPDDESIACGGLLAWCAALGGRVALLCLTRGGQRGESAIRTRELEDAAAVLGVADLAVLDHEDGMLPWIDHAAVAADIARAIGRVTPDIVVTFGEDGLYWHPDHTAVHTLTRAAVTAAGTSGPALYGVTMPPGAMRAVVEAVAPRRPAGAAPLTILGIGDVDAFGADAAPPTLTLDVSPFAARKLAAIRCHRSQLAGDALDLLTDDEAARFLGTEHFHRLIPAPGHDTFMEQLAHARSAA